ncbi:hypothetical protein COL00_13695 [Bacillus cereus]|uniref:insecticidal delta-endotoxin Cry8Ea1 family protein n=1 Tax=Bacillus cereus TaxID=1396 RepID=UPI0009027B51|nr:insecticidal delta-endotoxin Cry8Ea1 family protein [Bacillus cereus]PFV51279.1 hypothetical protein COL00_13695 [Bacillus cereus]
MNQNYNDEYEIMNTGVMGYQSRYPLAKTPGSEIQQMNYKDWMDMYTHGESGETFISARDGVIIGTGIGWAILGFVPVLGPGLSAISGILNVLLPILWPEDAVTAESQVSWDKLMRTAEEIANKAIDAQVRAEAITELQGIQEAIQLYHGAVCDWKKAPTNVRLQETVRTQFIATNTVIFNRMPSFRVQGFETSLLSTYAQAANLHLAFLRDGVQFGTEWGLDPTTVDRYYGYLTANTASYTNYCVRWYDKGLSDLRTTNNWNKYNNFRRDMTIMAMDLVSLWPTYDPKRYPTFTKSQLTRTVYTPWIGHIKNRWMGHPQEVPFSEIESNLIDIPRLFAWLRELIVYSVDPQRRGYSTLVCGRKQRFQNTLSNNLWDGGMKGSHGEEPPQTLTIPSPQSKDDIWKINTTSTLMAQGPENTQIKGWDFSFTNSQTQTISTIYQGQESLVYAVSGLPCRSSYNLCDPCDPDCKVDILTPGDPCNDKLLYSHRFAYLGAGIDPYMGYPGRAGGYGYYSYGWTHISADANNLIDTEKITQIPAVKASGGTDYQVIRGPGSTGGDLVSLATDARIELKLTASIAKYYQMRIRYASPVQTRLRLETYQDDISGGPVNYDIPSTPYSGNQNELSYNAFGYKHVMNVYISLTGTKISIQRVDPFDYPFIIDKIEFIPIEGSLEAYQADQDLEKARKKVNALFMSDAKDVLKLNVTDYALDQAANLVECLSDEFCAQEKMILLDQVKFAKRLSQSRNLLNYGDFESPYWSGENGWKTSPHIHVASGNPIFKGHYLHMPGANQPQTSGTVYPTYIYQKVDESKLKPYTRYHVRGFVGNSKDLELLVERYGKEIHVEMDVPNDIRYTLPMNECGGFERCSHEPHHTCTCKDTARVDTGCQCQDKMNRMTTGVYTNIPTASEMYPNGYLVHKSCGCKDPHVFSFHIDTGCVDLKENLGLLFAFKISSTDGVANVDNLEIIEGQPLTGEALARVKKREHKWKETMKQKRCKTDEAVQAVQTAINALFTNAQY